MPKARPSVRIPRAGEPPISEQEIAFCHYLLGHDAAGKRRTFQECARMAGLGELDQVDADDLSRTARVREYCAIYTAELARQMACQEALRRADFELSPMAIAGELFFIGKSGKDERARVAALAKLLDWMGPLEDRMKRATVEDLRYFAEHNHWPEERMIRASREQPPPPGPPAAAAEPAAVIDQVLDSERKEQFDF
jgi:hypothetical protein